MRVGSRARGATAKRRRTGALVLAGTLAALLSALPGIGDDVEPTEEPISARVQPSEDRRIESRLSATFSSIESLGGVEVTVTSGVVRLRGEVLSQDARELAARLAKQVEGVVAVENDLAESFSLQRRLDVVWQDLRDRALRTLGFLPLLLVALLVLAAFVWLARVAGRRRSWFERVTPSLFLQDLLAQVLRAAVWIVGVLLALEIVGATTLVGAVLGTAGVVGLAIGFAFRDLVENYIASILLSLRQPFAPNDQVLIDGQEGLVVRLTSRATILLSLEGNHVRIPNAVVFKGTIVNFTRKPERRFDFTVGVGVEEDLAAAQALARATLTEIEGVLAEPAPLALVEALADSSVTLRVLGWIDQRHSDWARCRSEAIRRVKEAFDRAGIEMPEPIQRVRVESGEERTVPAARPSGSLALDTSRDVHLDREVEAERAAGPADLLGGDRATE